MGSLETSSFMAVGGVVLSLLKYSSWKLLLGAPRTVPGSLGSQVLSSSVLSKEFFPSLAACHGLSKNIAEELDGLVSLVLSVP
jgi:hypothetical protein